MLDQLLWGHSSRYCDISCFCLSFSGGLRQPLLYTSHTSCTQAAEATHCLLFPSEHSVWGHYGPDSETPFKWCFPGGPQANKDSLIWMGIRSLKAYICVHERSLYDI